MYVTDPQSYNPAAELINTYLMERKQNHHSGTTKTAVAQKSAAVKAFRDGCATGLAAILNSWRVARYNKMQHVNLLSQYDMVEALSVIEDSFEGLEDKSSAGLSVWWDNEIIPQLNALAYPEALEEAEVNRHRNAVLKGEEKPTEDDRAWLEQVSKEAGTKAEFLGAVLNELDGVS